MKSDMEPYVVFAAELSKHWISACVSAGPALSGASGALGRPDKGNADLAFPG